MSEVLNVLRLMMSRLSSHLCPNGHRVGSSVATQGEEIICPCAGSITGMQAGPITGIK
jgi:excinuclease ABC subunit A